MGSEVLISCDSVFEILACNKVRRLINGRGG